MNKEISLTMGMGVYNEEKHIAEAIESLLAQTYKDFVLIISDNASTDRTQQICEDYAKKDKRIIYMRQPENKGSAFNFTYLLGHTETPFFMYCGGHDKWEPCFVEKLLPAFKEKDIILSYPKSRIIKFNGELSGVCEDDYTTTNLDKPVDRYLYVLRHLKGCNLFCGIWRTQALKNCDSRIQAYAPDVVILMRAAMIGKFKQCSEVLFWLRENRKPEDYSVAIKRQFLNVYGKKQNTFLSVMAYISESIKAPLNKQYSVGIITKLWVIINVIYYKLFGWYMVSVLKLFLKKILGQKIYFKLKTTRDSLKN